MLYRLVFLFGLIPWLLSAQPAKSGVDLNEKLYAAIEARLEQLGGDTARQFILQEVRKHCGTDDHCQYEAYHEIMIMLERRFNLPMAVFVVEEMVKLAQRQGNLAAEAKAYVHLDRYHSALGNRQLAFNNNEKALQLYEQLNDQVGINRTKFVKLIYSLSYRKLAEVLPEMEALLEKSLQNKDTVNASQMYVQLVQFAKGASCMTKWSSTSQRLKNFQCPLL